MKYLSLFMYVFCFFACAYQASNNNMICVMWAVSAVACYIDYNNHKLKE